jgi:hypothetical protein
MDPDLCPVWWSQFVWDIHFRKVGGHPSGPVNRPPDIDNIYLAIAQYSLTFRMGDQKAAGAMRAEAHANLLNAVKELGQQKE